MCMGNFLCKKMKIKLISTILIVLLLSANSFSQETDYSNKAFKIGFGLGANEVGIGWISQFGFQKTSQQNPRFRHGFSLQFAGFSNMTITDVSDQMERMTSFEYRFSYDLIKYKKLSLFIQTAPFINYTRGLKGTGGEFSTKNTGFYLRLVGGGLFGTGFRFEGKKYNFEIIPLNIHYGYVYAGKELVNHNYFMGYFQIAIDLKIKK